MARPLRVEYPGAYYHVINRGNNRENIFKNNRDRLKFLEYLDKASERFMIAIHTYCLMRNHFHLIVETPEPNLSRAMQWINVSYATYFNRKHSRHGHLFQGRFKSILIDADGYLKQLSRYIHLNPVRAQIVANPAEYLWSSYPAYIGREDAKRFLQTDWLLSCFSANKKDARRHYTEFVEGLEIQTLENPNEQVIEGFILGDPDFVYWVKEKFLYKRKDEKEIPQLRKLKSKIQLNRVLKIVCDEFSCNEKQIIKKGRKKNRAREVAIYLARDMSGMSCKDLGLHFGGVSGALISIVHNRIAEEAGKSRRFSRKLEKIKMRIFNI